MIETITLNLAYLLYVGSALIKTVVRLRIGMIVVSVAFIIWGILGGVWSAVIWNLAFGSVHAYQLYQLWAKHRAINLSVEERALHRRLFPDISLVDFFTLWSVGNGATAERGDVLIREQTKQESIMLIVEGELLVEREGQFVAELAKDAMIGERSYLTGDPANATVTVKSDRAVLHEWNHQKMSALAGLCPEAHDSILRYVGIDLATKLR